MNIFAHNFGIISVILRALVLT